MKTSIKTVTTLLLILLSGLFISCEDTQNDRNVELSFDLRLPQDENGFYHLTIDRNNWQTLHRVTGSIKDVDSGVENFWVEWDSNLYWYLGDTLGYVVNQYVNLLGQYVSVDTSYMIGFNGMEVPTTNQISYSNKQGEINNMIAPVKSMIGDTLYLSALWFEGSVNWGIVLK